MDDIIEAIDKALERDDEIATRAREVVASIEEWYGPGELPKEVNYNDEAYLSGYFAMLAEALDIPSDILELNTSLNHWTGSWITDCRPPPINYPYPEEWLLEQMAEPVDVSIWPTTQLPPPYRYWIDPNSEEE